MEQSDPETDDAQKSWERFLGNASEEQLAAVRRERRHLAEQISAMHDRVASRWSLSLGIGNGAALTAVGSKMLGETIGPWTYLLMPSALLFGGGLCAVGLSHGLSLWRFEHKGQVTEAQAIAVERSDMNIWREENLRLSRRLWFAETALEIASGVAFMIGVAYPLIVLWTRLFFKGSLLP